MFSFVSWAFDLSPHSVVNSYQGDSYCSLIKYRSVTGVETCTVYYNILWKETFPSNFFIMIHLLESQSIFLYIEKTAGGVNAMNQIIIEGNIFSWNSHAVALDADHTGWRYALRFNVPKLMVNVSNTYIYPYEDFSAIINVLSMIITNLTKRWYMATVIDALCLNILSLKLWSTDRSMIRVNFSNWSVELLGNDFLLLYYTNQ